VHQQRQLPCLRLPSPQGRPQHHPNTCCISHAHRVLMLKTNLKSARFFLFLVIFCPCFFSFFLQFVLI
jgi:hypothetical protein